MPVFKIKTLDKDFKVLVSGKNLQEIIDKGKTKFALEDDSYKVVLDDDGTEIDDDEILQELGGLHMITLVLLKEGDTWNSKSSTSVVLSGSTSTDNVVGEKEQTVAANLRSVTKTEVEINGNSLWNRFPKRLLDCCKQELPAQSSDRRAIVSIIADYMLDELKSSSRSVAARIATMITQTYPKTFQDAIGGKVVGNGSEALRAQIYNAVNYKKAIFSSQLKASIDPDTSADADGEVSLISRKGDQYGCVAYQPLLPECENASLQEEKRMKLQQYAKADSISDITEIDNLMMETYPSQRTSINSKHRKIQSVLQDWPWLEKSKYFIAHMDLLTGISAQTEWDSWLQDNGKASVSYFKFLYKRSKPTKKSSAQLHSVATRSLEIIATAEQASITERSIGPQITVLFPLIVNYFKESTDMLYQIIPDVDIDSINVEPYPVLIIKGHSLYDDDAEYTVLVEGGKIRATSLLNGLLIVTSAYFVFGLMYPKNICKTLEFLQRVLLKINPSTGRKQDRRKSISFDARVLKLSKELEEWANISK